MAKLTLNDITSGYGTAALYNANNTLIEAALENTLSRDGTSPNAMTADFDAGGYEVTNVGAPTNDNSAARLVDISDSDATGAASATLRSDLGSVAINKGASLIGVEDSAALFAGADVEAVLNEIQDNIDAHIADATAAHAASAVGFTPAGSIAATDVQAAIVELDADVVADRPYIDVYKNSLYTQNLRLDTSVSGNALTIAIKGVDGNDPSATNVVKVGFSAPSYTGTTAVGSYEVLSITSATSLTISSGSTLGTANGLTYRLWIVLFNTGSGVELGLINCYSNQTIFPVRDNAIASTTAEGGAGGADTGGVFYTTTALTSKKYRILGWIESNQTTAGTWAAPPDVIKLQEANGPLPGHIVQSVRTSYLSLTNTTAVVPFDNTIPQNTEGLELTTLSITPSSKANVVSVEYNVMGGITNGGYAIALFRNSTADAIQATCVNSYGIQFGSGGGRFMHLAQTTSSDTYKLRVGPSAAGTLYINGNSSGVQLFNGTNCTNLIIEEVFV